MAAVEIMFHREATDDRWMTDAACKGLTNLFFPAPAERPQARDRREAMGLAGRRYYSEVLSFARGLDRTLRLLEGTYTEDRPAP